MPYLAVLTPPHWQVEDVDEKVVPVNLNAQSDLVGITFHAPIMSMGEPSITD